MRPHTKAGPAQVGATLALFLGVATAQAADTLVGDLNGLSARWDRIKDVESTIDPFCGAGAYDSFNDGVPFVVHEIRTTVAEDLDITAIALSAEGVIFDPYLAIYCEPFDPSNPTAKLIATDDDGAGYPNAGFVPADGVTLYPGSRYFVVVTSYGSYAEARYGSFQISLGGTAYFPPSACVADVNYSGSVGSGDIMSIIAAWGPCAGCPEDLDGSGNVGFEDLLQVLLEWGSCP